MQQLTGMKPNVKLPIPKNENTPEKAQVPFSREMEMGSFKETAQKGLLSVSAAVVPSLAEMHNTGWHYFNRSMQ